jgi:large conductance mechanosensitive channel
MNTLKGRDLMKEKGKKFINEFKDFAMKGNVVDLAVGVVIGGAFNKIVSSLVNDIIMPLIGVLTGGVDFKDLSYIVNDAEIKYGMFIQNIVDFLIIALSIFVFIKVISKLNKKKEEVKKEEEKKLTMDQELLTEIRDLLKAQGNTSNY